MQLSAFAIASSCSWEPQPLVWPAMSTPGRCTKRTWGPNRSIHWIARSVTSVSEMTVAFGTKDQVNGLGSVSPWDLDLPAAMAAVNPAFLASSNRVDHAGALLRFVGTPLFPPKTC